MAETNVSCQGPMSQPGSDTNCQDFSHDKSVSSPSIKPKIPTRMRKNKNRNGVKEASDTSSAQLVNAKRERRLGLDIAGSSVCEAIVSAECSQMKPSQRRKKKTPTISKTVGVETSSSLTKASIVSSPENKIHNPIEQALADTFDQQLQLEMTGKQHGQGSNTCLCAADNVEFMVVESNLCKDDNVSTSNVKAKTSVKKNKKNTAHKGNRALTVEGKSTESAFSNNSILQSTNKVAGELKLDDDVVSRTDRDKSNSAKTGAVWNPTLLAKNAAEKKKNKKPVQTERAECSSSKGRNAAGVFTPGTLNSAIHVSSDLANEVDSQHSPKHKSKVGYPKSHKSNDHDSQPSPKHRLNSGGSNQHDPQSIPKHRLNSGGKSVNKINQHEPQSSPSHRAGARPLQDRRRIRISENDSPMNVKNHFHHGQKQDQRSYVPRNKTQTMQDEDTFEDHLPPNVVEGLLQLPNYYRGTLRINAKCYTEAYITDPSGKRDIMIEGIRNRNRALEGDDVVVALLPESEWKTVSPDEPDEKQLTAKVIHILAAVHPRQAVGILKPLTQANSLQALFSPKDSRVPRIRVPINECPPGFEKNPDNLYFARITRWDNVRFARGSLIGGCIGVQGDIDAETTAILLENQIRTTPYPPEIIPHFPDKLRDIDWVNREDLRNLCIFSIDPLTARDLDDALSCDVLENGNVRIGVHISDVAYYIEDGSPLDEQIAMTATSTYMVQSVYHMLPRELTMHCSLLPGQDKLAFSVFFELEETDDEVKVVSFRFTRSVINSCSQLAYEHAQVMIDDPTKVWKSDDLPKIYNGYTPEKLSSIVRTLNRLAIKLRKRRSEKGCLQLQQLKLFFRLDDEGLPLNMSIYENKESHRLIEDFMILANITVAATLYEAFPDIAFLRQHSPPLPFIMEKLQKHLESIGMVIDVTSAGSLQDSLMTYRNDETMEGIARSLALNNLLSRPMARARYVCLAKAPSVEELAHYGLNVPLYTHFTSPIRRYADIMVHRLLAAHLGYTPAPKWDPDYVHRVACNCNQRKYSAKKAGEASSELFVAVYLQKIGAITGYGVVIDVKDRSFDAIFCSTGTTVRLYSDKIGASVETIKNRDGSNFKLTWFSSSSDRPIVQVISVFSIIKLQIKCSATNTLKLEADLLPPWAELNPVQSSADPVDSTTPKETAEEVVKKVDDIDLSNVQLPDILDGVQECVYTSDDDGDSSPESPRQSPTPLDELNNLTLISRCDQGIITIELTEAEMRTG